MTRSRKRRWLLSLSYRDQSTEFTPFFVFLPRGWTVPQSRLSLAAEGVTQGCRWILRFRPFRRSHPPRFSHRERKRMGSGRREFVKVYGTNFCRVTERAGDFFTCRAISSWVANQTFFRARMYSMSFSSIKMRLRWPMILGCMVRTKSVPSR